VLRIAMRIVGWQSVHDDTAAEEEDTTGVLPSAKKERLVRTSTPGILGYAARSIRQGFVPWRGYTMKSKDIPYFVLFCYSSSTSPLLIANSRLRRRRGVALRRRQVAQRGPPRRRNDDDCRTLDAQTPAETRLYIFLLSHDCI
jgi:hypothetical protein